MRGHSHAEAATALQEALVHAERLSAEGRDRLLLDLVLRQVQSLHQALETFGSIHARFEVARTCLELGELARRAAAHIREARRLFTALGASRYVEQTRQPVGE